ASVVAADQWAERYVGAVLRNTFHANRAGSEDRWRGPERLAGFVRTFELAHYLQAARLAFIRVRAARAVSASTERHDAKGETLGRVVDHVRRKAKPGQ